MAIGDGNLSSPNGRVTKLRITCDIKYPSIHRRYQLQQVVESHFPTALTILKTRKQD